MKKSNLQHIKSTNSAFKVPKEYFDTIEDTVFANISTEKIPKKEGYKTPNNYFENVEDDILRKTYQEKHKKYAGFSIPKDYLDTLENTILSKLDNHKPTKVISLKKFVYKKFAPITVAASLLIVFFLNYQQDAENLEPVTETEIEQWIENDLISIDSYEIAEVYNDTYLENTTIFAEEEIEEYLNGTDIESLLLEN